VTTRAAALPGPQTVSDILERRAEGGRAPRGLTATVSVLAHAGFLAVLLLVGRPRKAPVFVPMSLPVRVVSPASLGRPEAAPAPSPVAAPAEPAPAAKAKPVIEKPSEKILPSAKALPEPKKPAKPEKPKPSPAVAKSPGGPAL
jgi:hypothetical protein